MPDRSSDRPEDTRFISGVLASRQPERLMEFYRDVLGFPLAEERHGGTEPHRGCELGDTPQAGRLPVTSTDQRIMLPNWSGNNRAGDGNRTRMTSLEGVCRRPV